MISEEQQQKIVKIIGRFRPRKVGVFGSYARNEHKRSSDIDILIEFEQRLNLLELIGIEQELTESLGIKVDLVTTRSLNPNLKSKIEQDLISIL